MTDKIEVKPMTFEGKDSTTYFYTSVYPK